MKKHPTECIKSTQQNVLSKQLQISKYNIVGGGGSVIAWCKLPLRTLLLIFLQNSLQHFRRKFCQS